MSGYSEGKSQVDPSSKATAKMIGENADETRDRSCASSSSLGLLDTKDMQDAFADDFLRDSQIGISDKLKIERMIALKTLNKIKSSNLLGKIFLEDITGNAVKTSFSYLFRTPSKTDGSLSTEYVNDSNTNTIDITALVTDNTIDLRTPSRISFEPNEMTGRSTGCVHIGSDHPTSLAMSPSIEAILASSFSQDVRNLQDALHNVEPRRSSANGKKRESMQRELDWSLPSQDVSSSVNFVASEKMAEQLIADELSWRNEYADIPATLDKTKSLSPNVGVAKKPEITIDLTESINAGADEVSSSTGADNFSIGQYFGARCDKLYEMLPQLTPRKTKARPLIDSISSSEDTTTSGSTSAASSIAAIDDKTFENNGRLTLSSEASSQLSLTTIEEILKQAGSGEDSVEILNKLMKAQEKKGAKPKQPLRDITAEVQRLAISDQSKEKSIRSSLVLSDTVSFSSSMLEQISAAQSRAASPQKTSVVSSKYLEVPKVSVVPSRKRSRSAVTLKENSRIPSPIPTRRSRSPSNRKELKAIAGVRSVKATASSPQFVAQKSVSPGRSPIEKEKLSLPCYRITTSSIRQGSSSPVSPIHRSVSSSVSTSSEFSHRGDVSLPLKATHAEVSWGSVKLRHSIKKLIQIKNTAQKRLVLRMTITGPGFQLNSSQQSSNAAITLQPQECRSISIVFCPTVMGPADGKLSFQAPLEYGGGGQRNIYLYGYGGHASVALQGVQQGPIGSKFLPMGDMRRGLQPFTEHFLIFNKGPLTAFASVVMEYKGVDQPFHKTSLNVQPSKVVIPPSSYAKMLVTYRPRNDELKKLLHKLRSTDVALIGNLVIITGDDPTRHRLKRQINKAKEQQIELATPLLDSLWTPFPREQETESLDNLKESLASVTELASNLKTFEVALTVTRAMDDTLMDSMVGGESDDSLLFHTICPDQTAIAPIANGNHYSENIIHSMKRHSGESWSVWPNEITLNPFKEETCVLTIKCNFYTTQTFQVDSNFRHLFKFMPSEGQIRPGAEAKVLVKMEHGILPQHAIEIMIYIEHDKITVPVSVRKNHSTSYFR